METTIAGVKYQPLEGRPLPGAGCYGNTPPHPVILSLLASPVGKRWGPGLGLGSMTRKHRLPDKSDLHRALRKLLGPQKGSQS